MENMKTELRIDPEFESKIPPLTADELARLHSSILFEGRLICPIVAWNGVVVDGHNRYRFILQHPEIKYDVYEMDFENRNEAIAWICKNQLGRRNLTPEQKKYLIGKQYEAERQARGGDRKSEEAQSKYLPFKLFCDLARSTPIHAERKNLFDHLCCFFVDDPFGFVLRIFAIAIRHMDGQSLATLALCFLHRTNLSARVFCKKFVEPVFDAGNIAVGAVRIDTVKVVVDGNVPNIVLRECVVDVQACQRGISSKS